MPNQHVAVPAAIPSVTSPTERLALGETHVRQVGVEGAAMWGALCGCCSNCFAGED